MIYSSPQEAFIVYGFHAPIFFLLNHFLKPFHFLLHSHFQDHASPSPQPTTPIYFPIPLHPQPLFLKKTKKFMSSLQLVRLFHSQVSIFFHFYFLGLCQFSILESGSFFVDICVFFFSIYLSFCLRLQSVRMEVLCSDLVMLVRLEK